MKAKWTILGLLLTAGVTAFSALAQDEDPKDIIADQLRRQGFVCEKPGSAVRDEALSTPHVAVWTLTCDNAAYRVHLIPDQAAKVEKLN